MYVCGVGGELAVFSSTAMVGVVNLSSVVLVVLPVFSGTYTRSGVGLYSVVPIHGVGSGCIQWYLYTEWGRVVFSGTYRPLPRARREFGTSIAPCRVVRLSLLFNRGECTVISLDDH